MAHLIVTRTYRVEIDETQADEAELLADGNADELAKLIRSKVGEFDVIGTEAVIVTTKGGDHA